MKTTVQSSAVAKCRVEAVIKVQGAFVVVMRIIEGKLDVFGEGRVAHCRPIAVLGVGIEAWKLP